jgi:hypothetical protein
MDTVLPLIILVVAAIIAFGAGAVIAGRRSRAQLGRTPARCRQGHLFTTVWGVKGAHRASDFGWMRIQRCPVGGHLTLVYPVDESTLTREEKKLAKEIVDVPEERTGGSGFRR